MGNIIIENDFFSREANPASAVDAELLAGLQPGQTRIYEPLDDAARARMELLMDEMDKASDIISYPQAFERASFNRYCSAHATLYVVTRWGLVRPIQPISEQDMPLVYRLRELREQLVRLRGNEDGIWYIWGGDMPNKQVAETADWRYVFDKADFRPFLIPYMLEDQSRVIGNIVVVSGGAYDWRSNRWEGYEAVRRFNELGYNCFLLQRRVKPYTPLDGALDLQRAVRYIKANAEIFGIGAINRIAVNGYSGGGMCICDMLADCYADRSPAYHYHDYIPDAVDSISSDVHAALLIYGALRDGARLDQLRANPQHPPIFIAVGQDDFVRMDTASTSLYSALRDRVPFELHVFASTGHGFGVGCGEDVSFAGRPVEGWMPNVAVWPELADRFLKLRFGLERQFVAFDA